MSTLIIIVCILVAALVLLVAWSVLTISAQADAAANAPNDDKAPAP